MSFSKELADELCEARHYFRGDKGLDWDTVIQMTIAYAILKHGMLVGQSVSFAKL